MASEVTQWAREQLQGTDTMAGQVGRTPQGRLKVFDVVVVAAAAFARLDEAVRFAADAGLSLKWKESIFQLLHVYSS